MNPLDPVYEILAKEVAYVFDKPQFQDLVQGFLAQSEYTIDRQFNDATTGFQAIGLVSTTPGKPPVLVFRGTDELIDDVANADPHGIGANQFAANQTAIAAWIAQVTQGQKPDLIGDSMGGAIAQLAAAALTSQVGRVVTFNSPGTSTAAVTQFQANGGQAQNVTHYIIQGDLVSLGGAAFLPGTVVLQSLPDPAINPLGAIDKHLLRRLLSAPPPGLTQTTIPVEQLNRPEFNFNQDADYAEFLAAYRPVNAKTTKALTSRAAVEQLRTSTGFSFIGLATQIRLALAVDQDNLLVGDDQNNTADGGQGKDRIFGKGGNDTLSGGAGGDRLDGGTGQDTLAGDAGADLLIGGSGNDTLLGGGDRDTLISVNANLNYPGRGEIDRLTGGAGGDRFILGSITRVFYADKKNVSLNSNGYALITDFTRQDIVQVHGEAIDYKLKKTSGSLPSGTGVYLNLNRKEELIGIVQGISELSFKTSFQFV